MNKEEMNKEEMNKEEIEFYSCQLSTERFVCNMINLVTFTENQ